MEEEKNKPITKKDLIETLGEFTEEILLPSVGRLINGAKQEIMDWTEKKTNEIKGELVVAIKQEDKKVDIRNWYLNNHFCHLRGGQRGRHDYCSTWFLQRHLSR